MSTVTAPMVQHMGIIPFGFEPGTTITRQRHNVGLHEKTVADVATIIDWCMHGMVIRFEGSTQLQIITGDALMQWRAVHPSARKSSSNGWGRS